MEPSPPHRRLTVHFSVGHSAENEIATQWPERAPLQHIRASFLPEKTHSSANPNLQNILDLKERILLRPSVSARRATRRHTVVGQYFVKRIFDNLSDRARTGLIDRLLPVTSIYKQL
jgi:Tfp pilus assembly protein FimV